MAVEIEFLTVLYYNCIVALNFYLGRVVHDEAAIKYPVPF